MIVSTKRLMNMVSLSNIATTDGTHKLNWEGFPVPVAGIIDQSKQFHPTGLSLCAQEEDDDYKFIFETIKNSLETIDKEYKPEFLVADCADGIRNGFASVIEDFTRINCWAHCRRNMEDNFKIKVVKENECKTAILTDLDMIQTCKTPKIFKYALNLFLEKWSSVECEGLESWLVYFKHEKINLHPNWFEAVAQFCPSTSNAIESNNRNIKDDDTFRERWPLGRFLGKTLDIVREWSIDRDPANINCKAYNHYPILTTKVWKDAYSWLKVGYVYDHWILVN